MMEHLKVINCSIIVDRWLNSIQESFTLEALFIKEFYPLINYFIDFD
jgi:hypothetical protein